MADQDWLEVLRKSFDDQPMIQGLLASMTPSKEEREAAKWNAIMAAGASILANNNGRNSPASAIGQGLLGGMSAHQAMLAEQRQTAQDRMKNLSGLFGLSQQLRQQGINSQFLKDFMGSGSTDQDVLSTGDFPANQEFGMHDRGLGETGAPMPEGVTRMAVQTQRPSMRQELINMGVPENEIRAALASGGAPAKTIADLYSSAGKWQSGKDGSSFRMRPTGKPEFVGIGEHATVGTGPDGSVTKTPIANSIPLAASAAGATALATEQAKASVANANELVDIPVGTKGSVRVPRGVALQFAKDPRVAEALGLKPQPAPQQAPQPQQAPEPPLQQPSDQAMQPPPGQQQPQWPAEPPAHWVEIMQTVQKNGIPIMYTPETGPLVGEDVLAYRKKMEQQQQPQGPQGGPQGGPPQMPQGGPPPQMGGQQPGMGMPQQGAQGGPAPAPAPMPPSPPPMPPGGPMPPAPRPAPPPMQAGGPPAPMGDLPMTSPPADVMAAREAAAKQQATQQGDINKDFAQGLNKYQVENFATGHKLAEESAYNALPAIKEVRKQIAAGAMTGGGAEVKTTILNTINGWFGTSFADEQVMRSQALKSALGVQLLANAKKLGYNPTDTDAKRIDDIVGRQGLSEKALLEIASIQERLAVDAIKRHNHRVDALEKSFKERGMGGQDFVGLRVPMPGNDEPAAPQRAQQPAPAPQAAGPTSPPPEPGAKWMDGAWRITRKIGGQSAKFKWVEP